jgi:hypothetical protein
MAAWHVNGSVSINMKYRNMERAAWRGGVISCNLNLSQCGQLVKKIENRQQYVQLGSVK